MLKFVIGNSARTQLSPEQSSEPQDNCSASQGPENPLNIAGGMPSLRTRSMRGVNTGGVSAGTSGRRSNRRRQDVSYEHAQPISDEEENSHESLKAFLASQVQSLKVNLENHVKETQAQFLKDISGHLAYMDKKFSQKSERKVLNSEYNQKHYDRLQSYKHFVFYAKYALENENLEDVLVHLDACYEAFLSYEREILLADKSPAGWELINRLGEGREEKDVRTTERQILEERRVRKRARYDGPKEDPPNTGKGNGGPAKFNGPCVWCGGAGHGYKFCKQWKEDVSHNRAIFDTNTRRWVRTQSDGQ